MNAQALVEDVEIRQRQARALGDPTRHRIYRIIEAADAPVTVAELTAELELNHNAIRQHLAVLGHAGLVVEELAPPSGPGRRRLRYRVDAAAAASWGGENPYEQLALLLVEILRSGRAPRDVGHDAGRRLAVRRRAASADPLATLVALIARQGFEPRAVPRPDGTDIVLGHCPFAAAATADPTTVCELHCGLAEGMADAIGGATVRELVPRNPKRAGCRLRLITQGAEPHV